MVDEDSEDGGVWKLVICGNTPKALLHLLFSNSRTLGTGEENDLLSVALLGPAEHSPTNCLHKKVEGHSYQRLSPR